jgi:hypothetical protein
VGPKVTCYAKQRRCLALITIPVKIMLESLAIVLVILWILGLVTSYTMGGLIHILLVIAVISILLRFISGRRV